MMRGATFHMNFLLREDIRARLAALCDGSLSREEVAEWALDIFDRHDVASLDYPALVVLERMAVADLDDWDAPYLYGPEDFTAWAHELSDKAA